MSKSKSLLETRTNVLDQKKRVIGIRHRVKKTKENEARPTEVAVLILGKEKNKIETLKLEDEDAELDFLLNRLPRTWRKVTPDEDLSSFPPHHIKMKTVEREGTKKKGEVPDKVPATYHQGFQPGDAIAMSLGGSGDIFAAALSTQSERIGALGVYRITPHKLKEERSEEKEHDAGLLAELLEYKPELFTLTRVRDRNLIRVTSALRARNDAMRARIACGNRLQQRYVGQVFLSETGGFPQGSIEKEYQAFRANDAVYQALEKEEGQRERELAKIVKDLDVWKELLVHVDGCGPVIAAEIISAIGDIRRFETDAKLKAFCGLHLMPDGTFPRNTGGKTSSWKPNARQAFYLFGDQCSRRPESLWGKRLRWRKARLKNIHPEVVLDEKGKKKWNDLHIHRTATWKTLSDFARWLHREWWKIERGYGEKLHMPAEDQKRAA